MTMQLVLVPEYIHGTQVFKFSPCDFYGKVSFQPMETEGKLLQPKVAACWTHICSQQFAWPVFSSARPNICTLPWKPSIALRQQPSCLMLYYYHSTWASSTLIILFSEMLKFSRNIFFLKENKESNVNIWDYIIFLKWNPSLACNLIKFHSVFHGVRPCIEGFWPMLA
jgi:hypothetical protein